MLHEEPTKKREQISLVCIDELVPQNHLLRKIDRVIDWSFIYELVKEKYSPNFGRPSIDPVILMKIVLIQYLYGISENHGLSPSDLKYYCLPAYSRQQHRRPLWITADRQPHDRLFVKIV